MKKNIGLILTLTMAMGVFAGCPSVCGITAFADDGDTYTFNEYITSSAVQTLNVHEWEFTDEESIIYLTQRGLYDIIYSDTDDYELICEMAAEAPVDVTAEYAAKGTYGIPEDATELYAFQIKLREDACWDDGTPINADTYIYSMQQILNPDMQNYRATLFTEGVLALANAKAYFTGGVSYDPIYDADEGTYAEVADDDIYFGIYEPMAWYDGYSLDDFVADYGEETVIDANGTDWYEKLAELCGEDNVQVTAEIKEAIQNLCAAVETNLGSETYDEEWLEMCTMLVESDAKTWDDVGIIKDDDYTITLVFANQFSSIYNVYANLATGWLVKEDLYEAGKTDNSGLIKTAYGTSVETYSSYGPYKLTVWQPDKIITLEKNDNWYGYSDPAFEDQYQTTCINYNIVDEHTTQMQLFLQGKLDSIVLNADDLATYGTSDYVLYTPTDYTWKLSFNTDYDTLKDRQDDGVNKTILTYRDFRKALSLAIDREAYCQTIATTSEPAYFLFNDQYYYDTEDFLVYRDTDQAKQVIMDTFDTDDSENVDAYNIAEASELLESAYQQALADGEISETDKVVLEFNVDVLSDTNVKAINFFNDALVEAAKGTSLEGRVSIEAKEVDDSYYSMSIGSADIIWSAWGGDDFNPYGMTQCYCDITLTNDGEHGFDPEAEELTAEIGGEEYTMSFYDWYIELCEGQWVTADTDTKLEVLAAIEGGILELYNTLPIYSWREAELFTQKCEYVTYDYSVKYSETFGGFRFMTYNYTDEEWDDYCSSMNNQLEY